MKVLLVDQFGEMGGAQRCLAEAAEGFSARSWTLEAAIPPGPLADALTRCGARIHTLPCGPFRAGSKTLGDSLRFMFQLPRQAAVIRSIPADVVFVNGPRVLPAAALGRRGRPLIHHVHWMVPQAAASWLARLALRRSDAFAIVSSRAGAAWVGTSVDPSRLVKIPYGVAGSSAPPPVREEIRHIAVLGRVSPEKGQLDFVQAARMVHEHIRGLRFTVGGAAMFGGTSYGDSVRSAAAGLPVEFPGWIEDTAAFLRTVDLLVVPSKSIDNTPRVILEAFAAGTPVMAFEGGGLPDLIQNGETGLLLRDRTAKGLASAILKAVTRPEELNRLAENAWQRWSERYTLRRYQSDICDAVEGMVRRHHQRNPLPSAGANAPA